MWFGDDEGGGVWYKVDLSSIASINIMFRDNLDCITVAFNIKWNSNPILRVKMVHSFY